MVPAALESMSAFGGMGGGSSRWGGGGGGRGGGGGGRSVYILSDDDIMHDFSHSLQSSTSPLEPLHQISFKRPACLILRKLHGSASPSRQILKQTRRAGGRCMWHLTSVKTCHHAFAEATWTSQEVSRRWQWISSLSSSMLKGTMGLRGCSCHAVSEASCNLWLS